MLIAVGVGGRSHAREAVLQWEDRRIDKAAKKLGVPSPRRGDIAARRAAFHRTKVELGREEILNRLRRDLRISAAVGVTEARLSRRRRRSVVDLHATGVAAGDFLDWFVQAGRSSHPAMVEAAPDHFDLRWGPRGQEVLETTGGSPFAVHFVVDYDDLTSLVTPADPAFPHQLAGVARVGPGRPIGGIRHQFRDTEDGMHGRLTVEFPLPTLPTMVAAHRWHLACEFSNWVEACARDLNT